MQEDSERARSVTQLAVRQSLHMIWAATGGPSSIAQRPRGTPYPLGMWACDDPTFIRPTTYHPSGHHRADTLKQLWRIAEDQQECSRKPTCFAVPPTPSLALDQRHSPLSAAQPYDRQPEARRRRHGLGGGVLNLIFSTRHKARTVPDGGGDTEAEKIAV